MDINNSVELAAFAFGDVSLSSPDDGDSIFPLIVGIHLPIYTSSLTK
jgi:hypothetical protein